MLKVLVARTFEKLRDIFCFESSIDLLKKVGVVAYCFTSPSINAFFYF